MTIMVLLVFMALSQIAIAAYVLYMFNDVEREARRRNAEFRAYIDARTIRALRPSAARSGVA